MLRLLNTSLIPHPTKNSNTISYNALQEMLYDSNEISNNVDDQLTDSLQHNGSNYDF